METKNSTTQVLSNTIKIKDLNMGCSYVILFHKQIDTKFGSTHILDVSADQGVQNFEMWSTRAINNFINLNHLNPCDKISFTVKQSDKFGFYAGNISLFTN